MTVAMGSKEHVFPGECDICGGQLSLESGWIVGGDFAEQLRWRVEQLVEDDGGSSEQAGQTLLRGPLGDVVKAICARYHSGHFPESEGDDDDGKLVVKSANDIMHGAFPSLRLSDEEMLQRIIAAPPRLNLYLAVHSDCFPEEEWQTYDVALDRIDSAEKALSWSFHLMNHHVLAQATSAARGRPFTFTAGRAVSESLPSMRLAPQSCRRRGPPC
jgi:hypothetical protein